jgi:flavin-dependent dehydrogenase
VYSGEGQATALASGLLVGEMAARCLAGDLSPAALPQRYLEAWRERFARPFAWNAAFRGLLLHPALGALGARVAGERLARFALARIYTPLAPSGVKIPSSSLAGR